MGVQTMHPSLRAPPRGEPHPRSRGVRLRGSRLPIALSSYRPASLRQQSAIAGFGRPTSAAVSQSALAATPRADHRCHPPGAPRAATSSAPGGACTLPAGRRETASKIDACFGFTCVWSSVQPSPAVRRESEPRRRPRMGGADGVLRTTYGAEGRPRSADTAIFSRVLYRLSYLGLCGDVAASAPRGTPGGRNRARTCDLPGVGRMLSQLSYSPARRPAMVPRAGLEPARTFVHGPSNRRVYQFRHRG